MTTTALVAIDWGTTSLRAYRIDRHGTVLERRAAPAGILHVPGGDFAAALRRHAGDWLDAAPQAPVLASGMIGSRQGWREVPYVASPGGLAALAAALVPVEADGRTVYIAPGLSWRDADQVPDVMRGEETQIVGGLSGAGETLALLPGTHSKWAHWDGERIGAFATFMTGEVFAALVEHTILGRQMAGQAHDPDAFARGVGYGVAEARGRGGLLKRLFSARTLGLFGEIPETGLHAYLSGLLIGTEIAEALAGLAAGQIAVTVLGDSGLVGRYLEALALTGVAARSGEPDAAARGAHRLACAAGLVAGGGRRARP